MSTPSRHACFVLLFALATVCAAFARTSDGTLGLVQTPHNGQPALTVAGGGFTARMRARAELRLVRDGREFPLASEHRPLPGGLLEARCTVPEGIAPGAYAIRAQADSETDTTARSVYVLEKFPKYYAVAHISDVHVGKPLRDGETPMDVLEAVFEQASASDAAFALVTGDVTESGDVGQFRRFLALLDTCALPTFVVPGNHDRKALHYERFFGSGVYMFRFGADGYLGFDTKDLVVTDGLDAQDGLLQLYRRALKPCRWTVGFTHRYEPMMGMRAQLALFVDNPLDFLLFGHWHRENTAEEAVTPWGSTRVSVVPAAIHGAFRVLDMTAIGLIPRPVQYVTAETATE